MDEPNVEAPKKKPIPLYLEQGWKLVFAPSRSKNPGDLMGKEWGSRAAGTLEEAQVWVQKAGNPNIGLKLGPESGVIDVEFDSEEGKAKLEELLEIDDPPTPKYTSGKSVHRLYKLTDSIPKSTVLSYKGVEARINYHNQQLQSILPPSKHPKGPIYKWIPGFSPADVEPAEVPYALLEYLIFMSTRKSQDTAEVDQDGELYVPEGERHNWMVKKAALFKEWGLSDQQLRNMVRSLDENVVHFDEGINKEDQLDSICSWADEHVQQKSVGYDANYNTDSLDLSELMQMQFTREWAVKGLMVMNEPMIVGGASKSLKTSVTLDLVLSLASGTPFLGKFEVPQKRKVMFISGESGEMTLQDNMKVMCREKGIQHEDLLGSRISFKLPKLDDISQVEDLIAEMKKDGIQIVFIDPLYRSLRVGDNASNIYAMGEKLEHIAGVLHAAGITCILLHHFKKQGQSYETPPDLEDLSQSGVGEFGRQFLMLKRKERYKRDGNHNLWFQWGGSAGHQGEKVLQVYTGTYETGLNWKVTLRTEEEEEARIQEIQAAAQGEALQSMRDQIVTYIENNPGCTLRSIRANVKGAAKATGTLVKEMIQAEEITQTDGPNRSKQHYIDP